MPKPARQPASCGPSWPPSRAAAAVGATLPTTRSPRPTSGSWDSFTRVASSKALAHSSACPMRGSTSPAGSSSGGCAIWWPASDCHPTAQPPTRRAWLPPAGLTDSMYEVLQNLPQMLAVQQLQSAAAAAAGSKSNSSSSGSNAVSDTSSSSSRNDRFSSGESEEEAARGKSKGGDSSPNWPSAGTVRARLVAGRSPPQRPHQLQTCHKPLRCSPRRSYMQNLNVSKATACHAKCRWLHKPTTYYGVNHQSI